MQKKTILIVLGAIAAVGLWYAFRPELLFVNKSTSETFPASASAAPSAAAAPREIASGSFRSVAHESKGNATLYQLADGRRTLRFTNFQTSNGPALHVYLVAAADATDNDTVKKAGFVDLGELKGNQGDQNYDVPADLDLNKYRAATIWCARFNVNFATAALGSGGMGMAASMSEPVKLASGSFRGIAHESKGNCVRLSTPRRQASAAPDRIPNLEWSGAAPVPGGRR